MLQGLWLPTVSMIPNYSKPDDWEKFNALGGDAIRANDKGWFLYVHRLCGIVHGTTITVLNAKRKIGAENRVPLFSRHQDYMSGAQTKSWKHWRATICGERNADAAYKRHSQGWVDEELRCRQLY